MKTSRRDEKIWIFNAGDSFEGNPKWLFMYLANHRKDITLYWFCYTQDLVDYMRERKYNACLYDSSMAKRIGRKAGVYVVNQVKEIIQPYLEGIKILNLWHGVGCKTIEKGVREGVLEERIAKKYIKNTGIYKRYQMFLVTSPIMERHFVDQCSLDEDMLIRAGYPCNIVTDEVVSYDHDFLSKKGLPDNTRVIVYAPTYRDLQENFMGDAIPDMESLISVLKETESLLIFKVHPKMNKDVQYVNMMKKYEDCPQLLFWNNVDDFYEVMDRVDIAIVDYSSIFYDLLAHGVKQFIRYIYDYDNGDTVRDFALDYLSNTCGEICKTFSSLLKVLRGAVSYDDFTITELRNKFWKYSTPETNEIIIENILSFTPKEDKKLPTLYSFDVFDTVIGRTTKNPKGIFFYVQEKISTREDLFSYYFRKNYFKIRSWCEANCREFFNKTQDRRNRTEITMDMIFERMQEVFGISEEAASCLKKWELEAEYTSSVPIPAQIDRIRDLLKKNEDVILISDMYLNKEFVIKLLEKADPMLARIPLFLSSECGYQKTKKTLFLEAYHNMDYRYEKWIHIGDNKLADVDMPIQLGIETEQIVLEPFNRYENRLVSFAGTYDSYQVANLFFKKRLQDDVSEKEEFAYCYASQYFVPYVWWALEDAIATGIECIYFISRDGLFLKEIADAIIDEKNYSIRTKYIYGSRKLWRIPSLIDNVDDDFFSKYGNFQGLTRIEDICDAGGISREKLFELFPKIKELDTGKNISSQELDMIVEMLATSEKYKKHLLEEAARRRKIVQLYLEQEIDFKEKYAFIEYWGRGYTQTCLARIIWDYTRKKTKNIFYYARSIYPSEGDIIRRNFSANNYSLIFTESVLSNVPYKSVEEYIFEEDGKIAPVIKPCDEDEELYEALRVELATFARDLLSLELLEPENIKNTLYDFGLSYFHLNKTEKIFQENIGGLFDSPHIYGSRHEYAPQITMHEIYRVIIKGEKFNTGNMDLTLARSKWIYRRPYYIYKKYLKEKILTLRTIIKK